MDKKQIINNKLYKCEYFSSNELHKTINKLKIPEELENSIYQDDREFIIAIRNEEIAGLVMFKDRTNASFEPLENVTSLSYVKVANNHKNKGVATMLLGKAIDLIKERKCILRRTEPTVEGSSFIFDKFTKMLKENNIDYIPHNLSFIYSKLEKEKFNSSNLSNSKKIEMMYEISDELMKHPVCKEYNINEYDKINSNFVIEAYDIIESKTKSMRNSKDLKRKRLIK